MNFFSFLWFLLTVLSFTLQNVSSSSLTHPTFSVEQLKDLAVQMELNFILLDYLPTTVEEVDLSAEFNDLFTSLKQLEESIYDQELLKMYCANPDEKVKVKDILTAAFQRDTVNPFAMNYNLSMLPLEQVHNSLKNVKTFEDLKGSEYFDVVIDRVKDGHLKFRNPSQATHRHITSVKAHIRKSITDGMEHELLSLFESRTRMKKTLEDIDKSYRLEPRVVGYLGSYLTIHNARKIWIHLPEIKFIPKNTNKI